MLNPNMSVVRDDENSVVYVNCFDNKQRETFRVAVYADGLIELSSRNNENVDVECINEVADMKVLVGEIEIRVPAKDGVPVPKISLLPCINEYEVEEARIQASPALQLERILKNRDWYSNYSDDFREWSAGEANDCALKAILPNVPVDDVKRLWAQYAPTEIPCPVN